MLAGVAEAGFGGDLPRVGLAEGTEGKFDAGKLLLRQVVEDVALVLGLVEGLFEDVLLPCPLDAGVVAGGDIAAAQNIGALKELVEFQIAVAVDAGVGGDAVLVGVDEAVDDAGGEFVAVWLQTTALNFPMALCWQLFFAGPIVRFVFGLIFREREQKSGAVSAAAE